MKVVLSELVKIFVVFSLLLAVGACSTEEDATGSLPSTTDPVTDPVPDDPIDVPVGEVEQTGFWVNAVTEDQYPVYMKKRDQWDENCFINKDTTSYEAIECVLDVLEGDLYIHDIELQYNAPPGLCDIVRTTPAYYYNYSMGVGPTTIDVDIDASGANPVQTSCYASISAAAELIYDITGPNNDGQILCSEHPELVPTVDGLHVNCVYNHGLTVDGDPNCCIGDVLYTTNTFDGTNTTTFIDDGSWGANYASCISPNTASAWSSFESGFPISRVEAVPKDPTSLEPTGLNESIIMPSNASSIMSYFSLWSNWYEAPGAANAHTHNGFFDARVSNLPYAVDPIDDLTGDAISPANDTWVFQCLGGGYEIRHEIQVHIREWNTLLDFVAYGASEGVTYSPDVVGAEGVNCDYDPIFSGYGCNDFWDFDDIVTNVGGSYGTAPGVDSADDRRTYFPRVD